MKKIEIEIPIYRAKKIDSDDNIKSQSYIKKLIGGNYHHYLVKYYSPDYEDVEIDPSTLAINFYDMLDRQGNKIFASLSEDGKGGDKMLRGVDMEQYGLKNTYYTAICTRGSVLLKELSESTSISFTAYGFLKELKIIGIQEWKNTYYYHYY